MSTIKSVALGMTAIAAGAGMAALSVAIAKGSLTTQLIARLATAIFAVLGAILAAAGVMSLFRARSIAFTKEESAKVDEQSVSEKQSITPSEPDQKMVADESIEGALSLLKSNFIEICSAAQQQTPLVANGERVYNAEVRQKSPIYRAGSVFKSAVNTVASLVTSEELLTQDNSDASAAMRHTQRVYAALLPQIRVWNRFYKQCMDDLCDGIQFGNDVQDEAEENKVFDVCSHIVQFSNATRHFFKLIEYRDARLSQLMKRYFTEAGDVLFPITHEVKICLANRCIIDLGSCLEDRPPLGLMQRVYKNALHSIAGSTRCYSFREQDTKEMKRFLEALRSKPVQIIHAAFQVFCRYQQQKSGQHLSVGAFELELMQHEVKLFPQHQLFVDQPNDSHLDQRHLEWTTTLAPGSIVYCNGHAFTLGAQVEKRESADKTRYFEVADRPDILLGTTYNRAMPPITETRNRSLQGPFKHVEIVDVDQKGRCFIVRRLHTPLKGIQWNATLNNLTDSQKACLDRCCDLLRAILLEPLTPLHLCLDFMMLDSENNPRCYRTTQLLPYRDFNAITDFAFSLSGKQKDIYEYIHNRSMLSKEKGLHLQRQMVSFALQKIETTAEMEAARKDISDHIVVARSQLIYETAIQLRTQAERASQPIASDAESVNDFFWRCYEEMERRGQLYHPSQPAALHKKTRAEFCSG